MIVRAGEITFAEKVSVGFKYKYISFIIFVDYFPPSISSLQTYLYTFPGSLFMVSCIKFWVGGCVPKYRNTACSVSIIAVCTFAADCYIVLLIVVLFPVKIPSSLIACLLA